VLVGAGVRVAGAVARLGDGFVELLKLAGES
jgi:hypothetical protein